MKKILAIIGTILILSPSNGLVFAQTGADNQKIITDLLAQITKLQAQINALVAQQQALKQEQGVVLAKLLSTLKEGDRGEQVKILQTLLAADPNIYPEAMVTGYYGKLTVAAVKKFKTKKGLGISSDVDQDTLNALNDELNKKPIAVGKDNKLCAAVPPGHFIAPGWIKKHGKPPVVPECQNLPPGIEKLIAGSTSDTIPPIISGVTTASITATTTRVIWTTNEPANGKVWYSTASPLVTSTAMMISSAEFTTDHNLFLSSLNVSTTYNYRVGSADKSGNMSEAGDYSFTTLP